MITAQVAQRVIERALSSGGDFAEIYLEDSTSQGLSLRDRKVESATDLRSHGAGIRIFKGLNSIYVYLNDTGLEALLDAADKAAQALGAVGKDGETIIIPSIVRNVHGIAMLPSEVAIARKVAALKRADAAARDEGATVSQVTVSLQFGDKTVTIANSEGLLVSDCRVRTRMSVQVVASSGTENQLGFEGPGALQGFEFVENLDIESVARTAARTALTMLSAPNCPAGVMPVIIDNAFGGVIFHEACGHSLEATSVAKGQSVFYDKLGQRIAAPIVSAVDDGTLPNEWGSINIDDEGTPSQRNLLIEDGILKGYLIDKLNARRMNMPITGSGRRENYRYAPTSRMTNTYILAGNHDEGEIISSTAEGLYAKRMGGGSVNPTTGEFNFAVLEGYMIKNGSIDRPVRGATLIGKGHEVLERIDRVGRELKLGQGMCGSQSGSVPTNVGQPMIRVSTLTVGGR